LIKHYTNSRLLYIASPNRILIVQLLDFICVVDSDVFCHQLWWGGYSVPNPRPSCTMDQF